MNPTLPLVRALVDRGVSVCYYGTSQYREAIELHGAEYCAYAGPDFSLEDVNPGAGMPKQLLPAAVALLPRLMAEAANFDGVVSDTCTPWGFLLAKKHQKPCAGSSVTFVGIDYDLDGPYGIGRDEPTLRAAAELRGAYGEEIEPSRILNAYGAITFVYSSREFQPATPDLERHDVRFTGPSMQRLSSTVRDFVLPARGEARVLYVSLGTALAVGAEFYRFVIDALGEVPRLVSVIAAGDAASELESRPPNVIVRRSVPQLEVLERADAFLTHAGSNSMHEALWHGVPLVMFPLLGDQHENARRSVEVGAGVCIERGTTADRVRALVESALDEASPLRAGARTIGESLRRASAEYGISGAASDVIDLIRRTS